MVRLQNLSCTSTVTERDYNYWYDFGSKELAEVGNVDVVKI